MRIELGIAGQQRDLHAALEILRSEKIEAGLFATESPQHAEQEARQAIDAGCDTVFACGGDGTIHNIIQVLAKTDVALGVLPLGTANALAHDLTIPFRVREAARFALHAGPRRVALGQVSCLGMDGVRMTRYFAVAAGVGVDAHLFYKLQAGVKQRLGMAAYYAKAWHMWFSYPMNRFRVEYMQPESNGNKTAEVTELLAVRIRHFGGLLQELAPGASLDRNDMRLILCHTANRMAYLAYVAAGVLRRSWVIPGIELAYGTKAACDYPGGRSDATAKPPQKIYVEADGELLGSLPAEITVVPDALTVLGAQQ